MMAVSIAKQPSLSASRPVALFKGDYVSDWDETPNTGNYDVAPDGRFLMEKEVSHEPFDHINIVFNWFEELKRAAPAK
jgi:hypothetical protein